jgi:hypothetical protein
VSQSSHFHPLSVVIHIKVSMGMMKSAMLQTYLGARDFPTRSPAHKEAVEKFREVAHTCLTVFAETMMHLGPPNDEARIYRAVDNAQHGVW